MNCLSVFTILCAICAHSITITFVAYPSILDMKTRECSLCGIGVGNGVLVPPRYVPEMPVWDSTEGLRHHFLWLEKSMKNGSRANNSNMKLGVHTDTHVDAPDHFYDNYYDASFDVDSLDLTLLNGLALLVDVPQDKNITVPNIVTGLTLGPAVPQKSIKWLEFHLHLRNAPKNSSLVKLGIEIP
ncbi:hypothetical protein JHK85_010358 [Glycine max]|nr:hypothetical protein JHK85_010358 [Glycine max]